MNESKGRIRSEEGIIRKTFSFWSFLEHNLKKKDLDLTVFRDLKILLQVISFLCNVRLIEASNISLSGKCY